VRELKEKPELGKILGVKDRSFPWETKHDGESDAAAMQRLVYEELDATRTVHFSEPLPIGPVWVYDTLAHVYIAWFHSGPENMRGADAGIEVEPLGWQTRGFLLECCRDGVREVFERFDACANLLAEEPDRIDA